MALAFGWALENILDRALIGWQLPSQLGRARGDPGTSEYIVGGRSPTTRLLPHLAMGQTEQEALCLSQW